MRTHAWIIFISFALCGGLFAAPPQYSVIDLGDSTLKGNI